MLSTMIFSHQIRCGLFGKAYFWQIADVMVFGDLIVINEAGQKISEQNLALVYSLFYKNPYLSKPQVVKISGFSIPTVTGHIKTLEQQGLIEQVRTLAPSGGRPALAFGMVDDVKVAIGVDVVENSMRIGVVDLKGKLLAKEEYPFTSLESQEQFSQMVSDINNFIEKQEIERSKILGVGISVQAVIANGGKNIIYSKISSLETLNTDKLSESLNLPVRLFHDVESAAICELWSCASLSNACYVSLSEHIGGCLIKHHKVEHGKNGYAGSLEHLCVVPDGLPCYCGHKGCLEAYCSLNALEQQCLQSGFNLMSMFELVHNKADDSTQAIQAHAIWDKFINLLAHALYNVYLLLERDIVLGGKIAAFLSDSDIQRLEQAIIKLGTFHIEPSFIHIAVVQKDASLIGAALYYIAGFLPDAVVPVKL